MSATLAARVRRILARRLGQATPESFLDPATGRPRTIEPLVQIGEFVFGMSQHGDRWLGWLRRVGLPQSWERNHGIAGARGDVLRRHAFLWLDEPGEPRVALDPEIPRLAEEFARIRRDEAASVARAAVVAQQERDAEARERDALATAGKGLKCPRGVVTAVGVRSTTEVPGALVCGSLAVHRNVAGTGWNVTHVRSGFSILRGVPSQALAKGAVAVFLKSAVDWTRDAKAIERDPVVRDLVRRVRRLVE